MDWNLISQRITQCFFYRTEELFDYVHSINANLLQADIKALEIGITWHCEFSFPFGYDILCNAQKILSFVRRNFIEFKLVSSIKSLYCAFVRSIFKYVAIVWNPFTSCGRNQIERVQYKFY